MANPNTFKSSPVERKDIDEDSALLHENFSQTIRNSTKLRQLLIRIIRRPDVFLKVFEDMRKQLDKKSGIDVNDV